MTELQAQIGLRGQNGNVEGALWHTEPAAKRTLENAFLTKGLAITHAGISVS